MDELRTLQEVVSKLQLGWVVFEIGLVLLGIKVLIKVGSGRVINLLDA
jgi:hypothetical protein